MKNLRKIISVLLAVLMVTSAVSIGAILAYHLPAENETRLDGSSIVISAEEKDAEKPAEKEKPEEIPDIGDKNPVPDDKLNVSPEENSVSAENMSTELPKIPEMPEEDKSRFFDEDNAIKIPFDEIYPEEFEEGVFEYDDETIMIKVRSMNEKREAALEEAGILKLEEMMVLEDAVWYVAYIEKDADITAVMEEVRALDFIKVAEYNFKYEAASIIDSTEISKNVTGNASVNDQWHLKTCGIQATWKYLEQNNLPMAGEGTVVAVIDTGVDYDHIDLKSSMWKNVNEIPDNGMDDDGNGYVDDYYGIDIVHGSGNGDDDHGHGTHVAGIIAAANNKEGVVGIAYNSKIMAVKAGQASGYFLQSDIAKAILYAWQNGADVINMSFGGSASTVAVQDALSAAYTDCILVAAAGNDGMHNEYVPGLLPPKPNYPAAFKYVLGVMSVGQSGVESAFTNWDVAAYNSVEYEVYAPGEQIWSTIPNDKYAAWSGTSMAAPVVSAMAATLRAAFGDRNTYPTKFIYGQIASTSEVGATCISGILHGLHNIPPVANAYSALTVMPKPEVNVLDFTIFDTEGLAEGNNGDGVIDAGETFELGFTLSNRWGMAENAVITIDSISVGGVANKYITFDGGESSSKNYGSIGTYSDKDAGKIIENDMHVGWEDPFMVTVAEDCPNDYIIIINYTLTYENALDEEDETIYEKGIDEKLSIEIVVRRGVLVPNDISEDITLTADKYWIIPYPVLVRDGVTLTVEAGTNIQFYCSDAEDPYAETKIPYLQVEGNVIFEGTEDNPINIFPSELFDDHIVRISKETSGNISMKYCNVVNPSIRVSSAYGCSFYNNYADSKVYYRYMSDNKIVTQFTYNGILITESDSCSFRNLYGFNASGSFDGCIFKDNDSMECRGKAKNCVFDNCSGSFPVVMKEGFAEVNYVTAAPEYIKGIEGSYGMGKLKRDVLIDALIYSGAQMRCFETASDIPSDWNSNSMLNSYYIGLYKDEETGEYLWTNGTKADDSIKAMIKEEGDSKYGAVKRSGTGLGIFFNDQSLSSYDHICFDNSNNLVEDAKSLTKILAKYLRSFEKNDEFSGNAIINSINQAEADDWFKIKAFDDPSHLYTMNIGGNYWGTTNPELIEKQIYDFDDDVSLVQLDPGKFLTEAPENVWPFVVDAGTIVDGEEMPIVGNEEVTFFVEFNRDMDTTIPLRVRFGSYYPYADYEIEGSYVSPRRWEGTTTLTTLIENGTQYFSIGNGKAADSSQKLYNDEGRFTFEIDTTEALAMNLQASATDEGIQLTWFQDDFETLMGYNVYRSTSEDGCYQKLNDTVIPVETKEFFDSEVEPGTWYYYNFTVVKTDLTESVPSGKQVIMAKDTMLPNVYHTPVYNAYTGNKVTISATVTDNLAVDSVKLYYRIAGTEEWQNADMGRTNDKFFYSITQNFVTTAGIEYYIEAFDGTGYAYKGSAEEPYFINVQVAVSDSDKGDVDGDGIITNKDALILLQGINDLYNLSLEEFERADINGDGELNAVEALRILQYVSGKITSVLF